MKMRMPRVRRRLCQLLVITLTVLWCLVLMAEIVSDWSFLSVWSPSSTEASERASRPTVGPALQSIDIPDDSVQREDFTCSANDKIPLDLPQPFQEFLRYRHCRAFPTLLTPSPCEEDLYLLLVVKSTAALVERRDALRETWGRAGKIQGQRVKLVFLLGHSNNQPQLELESLRHGDILQWDFMDVFFNLTLKEIGFLSWFSHECSKTQFVFKGDDDVFVNTDNLVEFLRAHKPDNHLFTGYVHGHGGPSRDRKSKYFIPMEIYPHETYPPFPSGGGYLMSRQTVLGLNVAAQKMALYPLDDVFVAFCLQDMGLSPTHHQGFLTFGFSQFHQQSDPCAYRKIMVLHKLIPAEMKRMWMLMKYPSLVCHS